MTSIIATTNRKHKQIGKVAFSDRETVYEYFRLVKNKDINRLLNLFADDAIIYEPFSNIQGGLRGKGAIKPFLEIVLMANDGLKNEIEYEEEGHQQEQKQQSTDNRVTALVTFERGESVQARFEFELGEKEKENYDFHRLKKIQSLYIQFI
jgi:hypothetical protein